jgi:hypothetical protein
MHSVAVGNGIDRPGGRVVARPGRAGHGAGAYDFIIEVITANHITTVNTKQPAKTSYFNFWLGNSFMKFLLDWSKLNRMIRFNIIAISNAIGKKYPITSIFEKFSSDLLIKKIIGK